jgi:hypothetical protein
MNVHRIAVTHSVLLHSRIDPPVRQVKHDMSGVCKVPHTFSNAKTQLRILLTLRRFRLPGPDPATVLVPNSIDNFLSLLDL